MITRVPRLWAKCVALSVTLVFCNSAKSSTINPMQEYNLIVFEDLESTSNIEGKTFVGGDVFGANSHDYAVGLTVPSSEVTLRVGGNIESGNPLNISAGSVEVGGSINRTLNLNGGGTATSGVPQDVSLIQTYLEGASASLAALPANSLANSNGNQLIFDAVPTGPSNRAVFDISADVLGSSSGYSDFLINLNGADEVVINVSGTSVNYNGANMIGSFPSDATREKIMWNFYEAETIATTRRLDGGLLAPYAHLHNSQNVEGSVAVLSMTQNGEVHLPISSVSLIPEPATCSLASLAVLVILSRRRSPLA